MILLIMNGFLGNPGLLNYFPSWFGPFLALAVIWTLIWKGIALWKSARSGSKVWFVVLLIVNTIGILDILYIYVFGKKHANN